MAADDDLTASRQVVSHEEWPGTDEHCELR
jgi:hypothetical protein